MEVSGTLWGMALLWNSFSGIFHDERSSTPGAASLEGVWAPLSVIRTLSSRAQLCVWNYCLLLEAAADTPPVSLAVS